MPEALQQSQLHPVGWALRDDSQDVDVWGGVWGEVLLSGVPGAGVEGRASKYLRFFEE